MTSIYDETNTELQLSELIRVFPPSSARRWMERLKVYSEFITRCYRETKEENEILRTINADLTNQVANLTADLEGFRSPAEEPHLKVMQSAFDTFTKNAKDHNDPARK